MLGMTKAVASKRERDDSLCRATPLVVLHPPKHDLHHREVLQVFVGLEERLARVELDEDAPYRPYIARIRPPQALKRASEGASKAGRVSRSLFLALP